MDTRPVSEGSPGAPGLCSFSKLPVMDDRSPAFGGRYNLYARTLETRQRKFFLLEVQRSLIAAICYNLKDWSLSRGTRIVRRVLVISSTNSPYEFLLVDLLVFKGPAQTSPVDLLLPVQITYSVVPVLKLSDFLPPPSRTICASEKFVTWSYF